MSLSRAERIADILGIEPKSGVEWQIRCLSPDHEDLAPSASIYVGEPDRRNGRERLPGLWTCYSCGAHGLLGGEALRAEPTHDEMFRAFERDMATIGVTLPTFSETWLDLFDYPRGVHPYWLERFDEATCWKFRLGYDYETESATIALRDNSGRVLGVIRRALLIEQRWKYLYPKGVDITDYLFNYSEVDTSGIVVVTEGATDAMAAEEMGYPAVAIYGSRPSEAQVSLLNRAYPRGIVTFFDNDTAGKAAADALSQADLAMPVKSEWLLPGYDLAKLDKESRKKVLARACASLR